MAKRCIKENHYTMDIMGVRKVEGGVRAGAYSSCFMSSSSSRSYDLFMPVWWLNNADKVEYEKHYNIKHSNCYTVYGMKRTGCAGCPFNKNIFDDLHIIQQYEPKLFHACMNIFGPSYAYKRAYDEFKQEMKQKQKLGDTNES